MHGFAHVHQVNAKMRNQPERVEEQMSPGFLQFPLRIIKSCTCKLDEKHNMYNAYNTLNMNIQHNTYKMYYTWSCSYIATVGIPTHYPSAPWAYQVTTSSVELNPWANFSHCLYLEIGSIQVLMVMCKTMTHTQFPCVSVTLLLVASLASPAGSPHEAQVPSLSRALPVAVRRLRVETWAQILGRTFLPRQRGKGR